MVSHIALLGADGLVPDRNLPQVSAEALAVSGATTVPVVNGWTYELSASSAASVSLDGGPGTQVAILWSGVGGIVEGQGVSNGETWAAVRLTAGWRLFLVAGPVDVSASTPRFDDLTATVVLAADRGVRWRVGGVVKPAGSVPVAAPATVTVTASALPGYQLVGASSWSHTFAAPAVTATAPDDLSGLSGWFDPTVAGSVTVDESSRVSEIANRMSGGPVPVQSDPEKRLLFSGSMNGLPVLRTSSAVGTDLNLSSGVLTQPWASSYTLFAVARCDSTDQVWNLVTPAVSVNPTTVVTLSPAIATSAVLGRTYFVVVTRDGTNQRLWVDGVEKGSAPSTGGLSAVGIGATTQTGNSTIGDTGYFSRTLTASEIESLYLWARAKWGLL